MAAMKAAITWLAGFLNDKGIPSSTRLIMLTGTLVPLTVWTGLSIYHLRMESIPESVLAFVSIVVTLKGVDRYIAAKAEVAQIEKDKPPAPEPAPPAPPAQNVAVQVTQGEG
jgi:hypothetical protein